MTTDVKAIQKKMRALGVKTDENKSFAQLTTFGVGGRIALTVYPDTPSKCAKALKYLRKNAVKTVTVGRGSNILASDDDFDGVAVVTTAMNGVKIRGKRAEVLAGTSTKYLARLLCQRGLCKGEFLACLPATVGGAVVTNAGCFGQDMAGILKSVKALKDGRVVRIGADECKLGKRTSVFCDRPDWTVLSLSLQFEQSTPQRVADTMGYMQRQKASRQPLNGRSAGCVLYHESVAVSRLIDEAGLKGFRIGGAEVSHKHAGFVLNVDKATALDIYLLIQHIRKTLWERFGLFAKTEVRLVGFGNDDFFTERKE